MADESESNDIITQKSKSHGDRLKEIRHFIISLE